GAGRYGEGALATLDPRRREAQGGGALVGHRDVPVGDGRGEDDAEVDLLHLEVQTLYNTDPRQGDVLLAAGGARSEREQPRRDADPARAKVDLEHRAPAGRNRDGSAVDLEGIAGEHE